MTKWNLVSGGPSRRHLRQEHLLSGAWTVTVNRAIDVVDQGIRVDAAAVADSPVGCWIPCALERYLHIQPHIQLWVSMRPMTRKVRVTREKRLKKGVPSPAFLKSALKILPPQFAHTLVQLAERWLMEPAEAWDVMAAGPPLLLRWDDELPLGTGMRVLPHGTVEDVNKKGFTREPFTMLCALERIWRFEPEVVRILSADMVGPWIEGKTEEECHEFEKGRGSDVPLDRWRHEKNAIEISIANYRKRAKQPVEIEFITPEPVCVDVA